MAHTVISFQKWRKLSQTLLSSALGWHQSHIQKYLLSERRRFHKETMSSRIASSQTLNLQCSFQPCPACFVEGLSGKIVSFKCRVIVFYCFIDSGHSTQYLYWPEFDSCGFCMGLLERVHLLYQSSIAENSDKKNVNTEGRWTFHPRSWLLRPHRDW